MREREENREGRERGGEGKIIIIIIDIFRVA